jgi:hypothetical protein
MCISVSIIFYFKDVTCVYIFILFGPSVENQFDEWTNVFSCMDHILSSAVSDLELLISRNYKFIVISGN